MPESFEEQAQEICCPVCQEPMDSICTNQFFCHHCMGVWELAFTKEQESEENK